MNDTESRRRFLRRLATTSAGVAGASVLPPGIAEALAIPAYSRTRSIRDVKHIVVLMQENRSFDHYFGTLRGVRGFGDPRAAKLPSGRPVWFQPAEGGGVVLPYRPDLPDLGMQYMDGTPHNWPDSHGAWNGGRYDGWIANKGELTMAYLAREDIPYHYALADAFTICDAYHCSLMGATDPNRYHLWTGWVGNDGRGGGPVVDNSEAGYDWSTFPERLEAAGISWKIYQDIGVGLDAAGYWGWTSDPFIGNYGDNSLLYFHQYQNAAPGTPLYERARTGTNTHGDPTQSLFDVLRRDVATDSLPQVSWIAAPEAYSEHSNWPANFGAWYTSQVLEILASNPKVWSRTALFVTYDENDGFFDHVVPPTPALSRREGQSTVPVTNEGYPGNGSGYALGPYGLGARVPMTVVSPWTKGGWVCSQLFDHTSVIRFIEQRYGWRHPNLIEANITPWRRAVCGDLTSAFNFADPDADLVTLPPTSGYRPPDQQRHPSVYPEPPATQQLPRQEQGLRRSRPLPYALAVDAALDVAARRLRIRFANLGRATAVLQVSTPGKALAPRSYTVEPAKELFDDWNTSHLSDGHYDLLVGGPNGFSRRLRGPTAALAEVRATERPDGHGAIALTLSNATAAPLDVVVTPHAYMGEAARRFRLAAGARLEDTWDLARSRGWYDLSVTVDGEPLFLRQLTGRVETGLPGISDPAIGS